MTAPVEDRDRHPVSRSVLRDGLRWIDQINPQDFEAGRPIILLDRGRSGSSIRQAGHRMDQKCRGTTFPLKSAKDTIWPEVFCNLKSAILNGLGYIKMFASEARSEANAVPEKKKANNANTKNLCAELLCEDLIWPPPLFLNIDINIIIYNNGCQCVCTPFAVGLQLIGSAGHGM